MTVIIERTDVRNDIRKIDHMAQILDKGDHVEIHRGCVDSNLVTIVSKKNNRILGMSMF